MKHQAVVPQRFRDEILSHLALNFAGISDYPLILGIFGPPGEGKTFQVSAILASAHVQFVTINAADLESERAGQPGKMLLENYVVAARDIERGTPTVMVVNDIDTTVGEWDNNTGTVNHQQLLAQLMHLADSPTLISPVGAVRRVPILVTGNDMTKLYTPLRRPGRMKAFAWLPSIDEKRIIVKRVLAEFASPEMIDELCDRYQCMPVAFFSHLRVEAVRVAALEVLRQGIDYRDVARNSVVFADLFASVSRSASIDLVGIAADLVRGGQDAHRSYLDSWVPVQRGASVA